MNQARSRLQDGTILAGALIAGSGLWLTGDHSVDNLAVILLSVGSAAAVAWLSPSRPVAAFGILFLMTTLSAFTVSTPVGNMRLEQPAIVAGYAWAMTRLAPEDSEVLPRPQDG